MENNDVWLKIGGSSREELVLAVDFTATGRPDARFSDLFSLTAAGRHNVWETMPQAIATDVGPGGQEYLDRWFDSVRESGRPVGAVLGFCAGSVYAAALAERLTQWQESAPQLILFDPELANPLGLYWQFHMSLSLFESIVGPEPISAANTEGHHVLESTDDIRVLGTELVRLFRGVSEPAFDQLDLDEESRTEFTESFTAFVAYVVAAGDFDSMENWHKAVAFTSASPLSGLNRLRSTDPETAARVVAGEIRFGSEHMNLLRDEDAAKALDALLSPQDLSRQIRM